MKHKYYQRYMKVIITKDPVVLTESCNRYTESLERIKNRHEAKKRADERYKSSKDSEKTVFMNHIKVGPGPVEWRKKWVRETEITKEMEELEEEHAALYI